MVVIQFPLLFAILPRALDDIWQQQTLNFLARNPALPSVTIPRPTSQTGHKSLMLPVTPLSVTVVKSCPPVISPQIRET